MTGGSCSEWPLCLRLHGCHPEAALRTPSRRGAPAGKMVRRGSTNLHGIIVGPIAVLDGKAKRSSMSKRVSSTVCRRSAPLPARCDRRRVQLQRASALMCALHSNASVSHADCPIAAVCKSIALHQCLWSRQVPAGAGHRGSKAIPVRRACRPRYCFSYLPRVREAHNRRPSHKFVTA